MVIRNVNVDLDFLHLEKNPTFHTVLHLVLLDLYFNSVLCTVFIDLKM